MMYHGGPTETDFDGENPARGGYDVCLTPDRDVAAGYATEDGEGVVHTVECDAYIGGMADVREAVEMADVGPEAEAMVDGPYAYAVIDEPAVQGALRKMGVEAVRYEDEDWNNETHECIRVIEPGHIDVAETDRVA